MTEILTFSSAEVTPDRNAVFENQGIPPNTAVCEEIEGLYTKAVEILLETIAPAGVLGEMSKSDFQIVYPGEGRNEPTTPVADIYVRADHLALFAVTLGERIGREIDRCFKSNDFALASMLDSAASAAADKTAELAQRRFGEVLSERGFITATTGILRYSPGYCGWDISGQKKLFDFLDPQQIGLTLRDSFLMEPLKSVSGVIIAGRKDIHNVQDVYPFCARCETHSCRERIRALLAE